MAISKSNTKAKQVKPMTVAGIAKADGAAVKAKPAKPAAIDAIPAAKRTKLEDVAQAALSIAAGGIKLAQVLRDYLGRKPSSLEDMTEKLSDLRKALKESHGIAKTGTTEQMAAYQALAMAASRLRKQWFPVIVAEKTEASAAAQGDAEQAEKGMPAIMSADQLHHALINAAFKTIPDLVAKFGGPEAVRKFFNV